MTQKIAAPAISVVIAAFDAESTLGEQLSALARQKTSFSWEVLLCDNGSHDGTVSVAQSWVGRVPGLRILDASARRGASAARNIGGAAAGGPLLAFCDADDVVADDWVANMLAALQQADIVGGAGETSRLNDPRAFSVSWSVDANIVKPYWPRFPAAASSNLGVRADVFVSVGGFDESLTTGEDIDLCWRVQLAGGQFLRSPDTIVHIRKRRGLRAVYRQAAAYAIGDLQLRHKYANVIAAEPAPAIGTGSPPGTPAIVRRGRVRRALRLLRPDGLADAAWRWGSHSGSRRGRIAPGSSQLEA